MKTADWIGVVVLGVVLVGGGAYAFTRPRANFSGNVVPQGGAVQYTPPSGASVAIAPQVAPVDNTLRDVKAGLEVGKQALGMFKDLWGAIESFGD